MPKFYKKINNNGFSFVPLIILVLAVGLVGIFSFSYFQNNKDVLQYNTYKAKFSINYTSNNLSSYNTSLVLKLDLRNIDKQKADRIRNSLKNNGYRVEYFCDDSICPNSENFKPSLYSDSSQIEVRVPNDKRLLIKNVNLNLNKEEASFVDYGVCWNCESESVKWVKSTSGIGANFVSNNIIVNKFDNGYFDISGEGEAFANFVRELKTKGLKFESCNYGICRISTERVGIIKTLNSINFSTSLNKSRNYITFDINPSLAKNIKWKTNSYDTWSVSKDNLGITRKQDQLIVSFSERYGNYNIILSGEVASVNQVSNDIKTKGVTGVGLKTSVVNPLPKCYSISSSWACEFTFTLPKDNYREIYIRPSLPIVIKNIPTGWNINSNNNGIRK